jgi:hypothetical protein
MLTNRIYYSRVHPATRWTMRAQRTPLIMRRALGECVRILFAARRETMLETIYHRGLQFAGRFTWVLYRSETIFFAGTQGGVANNAKSRRGYRYAQRRHDMRGYSKRLQMRKESFWASKATRKTAPARRRIVRDAMRECNRIGRG